MQSGDVRVRLLGGFELRTADGEALELSSARAESLLAYLLLHREAAQARERVAYLLWPDSTEPQARTNLRHVLHTLRRAQADQLVEITPRTVRWRPDAAGWIDVATFEHHLDRADAPALAEAVAVYSGDLLPGNADEWVVPERERLRGRYLDALDQLGRQLHARGDHAAAAAYTERLLLEDPLREATYRLLMAAYDASGDRARALRAYHLCASTLERELDIAPSPQTQAAYAALLPNKRDKPAKPNGPPLVGRAAERERLIAAWRVTERGGPRGGAQLIMLTGEPGIGKTRLAEEFARWCAHRGAAIAIARAHAAEGALAYAPVVAWLRAPALRPLLARLVPTHQGELARLLPELRGAVAPEPRSEDEQRQRLFDAVAHALGSALTPVVLVADDLHRFDRESLRLLHYVLRADPRARLLVTATARPEELDRDHPAHATLGGLRVMEQVTEIALGPLDLVETAVLAARVAGRALTAPDAERVYAETEGNPLFLVESLRAGWSGAGPVPPKVQAVIEARLAQLSGQARDLIGVAAAIGREFSASVLTAAAGTDEDTVVGVLDELWSRRIIREQGEDAYDFAHDKIREVAYQGLSVARRRRHHRRIAEALEQLGEPGTDAVSGEIARHYECAGATASAVRWLGRAADAATSLYASSAAAGLLTHALELVRTLPGSAARDIQELELLTALFPALGVVEGWTGPGTFAARDRALELLDQLGAEPEPPLARSLAFISLTSSDFDGAERYGERLRARGERAGDPVLVVEGAYLLGIAAFWQARLEAAREHFELAVRCYRPEHGGVHLLRYGLDPRVVCTSRLANTLWLLDRPADAVAARETALGLAEDSGHPFSRAVALVFAALLAVDMDDQPHLRRYAAELTATGLGERPIRASAQALTGYVEVLDGRVAAGLARCREAGEVERARASAPGSGAVVVRVLLAACVAAGDVRGGLAAAEDLLRMDAARIWWPEARRRRDEFLAHPRG